MFILDCEESNLQQRLEVRLAETGRPDDNEKAVAARIAFFKQHTLPTVKHFDDMGKLVIVSAHEIMQDIINSLTFHCGMPC